MPAPPHNPSRLRSERFAKHRQYVRGWTHAERGVLWLSVAGLALACVFVLAYVRPNASTASPGPLARPHAAFDSECAACHRPHATTSTGFLDVGGRWNDFTCYGCHGDAPHHPAAGESKDDREKRCADCHHDHKGANGMLAAVQDAACVKCHHGPTDKAINDWASHPEFAKLEKAPARRMKFSHSLHLSPGLQRPSGTMALECASCHRLDSGRGDERVAVGDVPREAVMPPRADGRHMLPVVYELHCRSCHPLNAGAGGEAFALPHRVQGEAMEKLLAREITTRVVTAGTAGKAIPLVGGRLDPREREKIVADLDGKVKKAVGEAKNNLYRETGTCAKCHDLDARGSILPPDIPTVWNTKARFSHAAHRATACLECHPGKATAMDAKGQPVIVEREPLAGSLPGVATCRECHGPREAVTRAGVPGMRGGVRHTCTTCHGYHDAARPLHGLGAPARDPEQRLPIDEFMRRRR